MKLMASNNAADGVMLMANTGIMDIVIPSSWRPRE